MTKEIKDKFTRLEKQFKTFFASAECGSYELELVSGIQDTIESIENDLF